jgi:hypothetical protein
MVRCPLLVAANDTKFVVIYPRAATDAKFVAILLPPPPPPPHEFHKTVETDVKFSAPRQMTGRPRGTFCTWRHGSRYMIRRSLVFATMQIEQGNFEEEGPRGRRVCRYSKINNRHSVKCVYVNICVYSNACMQ